MSKKIKNYIEELELSGKIQNDMLLSESERKAALEYFKDPNNIKLSKDKKLSKFTIIKDDKDQKYAIYSPNKETGFAKGAMGLIKIAQNIETGKFCLVKIQKIKKGSEPKHLKKDSRKEKEFASKRGIVHGYQERTDSDKYEFKSYIFMNEIPGIPLGTNREAKPTDFLQTYGDKLSEHERLTILLHLLENLQELKSLNIIHRDLHGGNIFIDIHDNYKIYFIDYGLALVANPDGLVYAHAGTDLLKQKDKIRYGNGIDFITMQQSIDKLKLLSSDELKDICKDLVKASGGENKMNYNSINLQEFISAVKNRLEITNREKPNL